MIWDIFYWLNPAELYLASPYLWDALLLLALFLGVSQHVFTKKQHYGKRHGKTLAISVSLILTFATTLFMYQRGWNLATSGINIIALTIIFAVFFTILYDLFTNMLLMSKLCAASLAFLITYPGIQALFGEPGQGIAANQPLLAAFLTLLVVAAVISLFVCIGQIFPKGKDTEKEETSPQITKNNTRSEKPEKKTKRKDHEIEINIVEPRLTVYQQGTTIPIRADITGGRGKYESVVILNNQAIHYSKNPVIQHAIQDLEPGKYKLEVVVEDKKQQATESTAFEVTESAQQPEEETQTTPDNESIHHDIQGFTNLVGAYRDLVLNHQQAANDVLRQRAANQPTATKTQTTQQYARRIREHLDKIRTAARTISRDENLAHADEHHTQNFLDAVRVYYRLAMAQEQYWQDFETCYNDRQPPMERMT